MVYLLGKLTEALTTLRQDSDDLDTMQFLGTESHIFGAEWELQLLNRDSLDLGPGIESLLADLGSNPYVKPELIQF